MLGENQVDMHGTRELSDGQKGGHAVITSFQDNDSDLGDRDTYEDVSDDVLNRGSSEISRNLDGRDIVGSEDNALSHFLVP